jgi:putative ABC transport system substrate-binding protein
LFPRVTRVTALWNPADPAFQQRQLREARAVAMKLRIGLQPIEARTPQELDRALAAAAGERAEALLVLADPLFVAQARHMADIATRQKLPMVGGVGALAEAGAIATYGADDGAASRRAAVYVDRILEGAKPADLPVEQTTRFELVINARTARALGVTIPHALIARADRVIR